VSNLDRSSFADRLLNSDPPNDELRRRYEEQKLALTERRVSRGQVMAGWLAVIIFTALACALGYQTFSTTFLMPPAWKLFYGTCSTLCAAMAIGMLIILACSRDGRITINVDRVFHFVGGLSTLGFAAVVFKIALESPDSNSALRLAGGAVFFAMITMGTFLFEQIRRAKLEARVRFLELELRLMELSQLISSEKTS